MTLLGMMLLTGKNESDAAGTSCIAEKSGNTHD
jgi:hypothetical protein